MAVQIIKRQECEPTQIDTIDRIGSDAPQISYSNEGRITVRIPQHGGDTLIVFDRPLSRELIRFIKNGIQENPLNPAWCRDCATELNDDLPF